MKSVTKDLNLSLSKKNKLSASEKSVFDYNNEIINLFCGCPRNVKTIKISENMRKSINSSIYVKGLWLPEQNIIVIKKSELKSLGNYSGILIHELIHAKTGELDVSRVFEKHLTDMIGIPCIESIKKNKKKSLFELF